MQLFLPLRTELDNETRRSDVFTATLSSVPSYKLNQIVNCIRSQFLLLRVLQIERKQLSQIVNSDKPCRDTRLAVTNGRIHHRHDTAIFRLLLSTDSSRAQPTIMRFERQRAEGNAAVMAWLEFGTCGLSFATTLASTRYFLAITRQEIRKNSPKRVRAAFQERSKVIATFRHSL